MPFAACDKVVDNVCIVLLLVSNTCIVFKLLSLNPPNKYILVPTAAAAIAFVTVGNVTPVSVIPSTICSGFHRTRKDILLGFSDFIHSLLVSSGAVSPYAIFNSPPPPDMLAISLSKFCGLIKAVVPFFARIASATPVKKSVKLSLLLILYLRI